MNIEGLTPFLRTHRDEQVPISKDRYIKNQISRIKRTGTPEKGLFTLTQEKTPLSDHPDKQSFMDYSPIERIILPDIKKKLIYNPHRKSYIITFNNSGIVQHVLSVMPPALQIKLYTLCNKTIS